MFNVSEDGARYEEARDVVSKYIAANVHDIQKPQYIINGNKVVVFKRDTQLQSSLLRLIDNVYDEYDGQLVTIKGVKPNILTFNNATNCFSRLCVKINENQYWEVANKRLVLLFLGDTGDTVKIHYCEKDLEKDPSMVQKINARNLMAAAYQEKRQKESRALKEQSLPHVILLLMGAIQDEDENYKGFIAGCYNEAKTQYHRSYNK